MTAAAAVCIGIGQVHSAIPWAKPRRELSSVPGPRSGSCYDLVGDLALQHGNKGTVAGTCSAILPNEK